MPVRLTAAVVFALVGALAVLGFCGLLEWNSPSHEHHGISQADALTFAWQAALSAGLTAACIGPCFRVGPVNFGIATMLLANIPFAALVTLDRWLAGGIFGRVLETSDLVIFFLKVLLFYVIFAGIPQIITGVLAGLTMKHLLKN